MSKSINTILKIIDLTNLIPRKVKLSDPIQIFQKIDKELRGDRNSESNEYIDEIFTKTIKVVRKEIKYYPGILEDVHGRMNQIKIDIEIQPSDHIFMAYFEFWEMRELVWFFAKGEGAIIYSKHFDGPWLPPEKFNGNFDFILERLKYNETLKPALKDADLSRLRICAYCQRVFWAFRPQVTGCSKRCNQNIRARKRRAKITDRFQSRVQHED